MQSYRACNATQRGAKQRRRRRSRCVHCRLSRRTMPSRSNPRGQTARPGAANQGRAQSRRSFLQRVPARVIHAGQLLLRERAQRGGAARLAVAPRLGPRHLILGTAPQGARRAHRPALGLRGGGGTRGACAPRLRGGVCADAAAGAVQPSTRIAGRWIAPPQLPPCARRCGPRVARASTPHSRRAHPLLFRWRTAARRSFLPLFPPPYPRRWPLRRPRPWAARFRRRWALRQAACLARRCRAPRRALRRARRLRQRLPPSTRRSPLRCRLRCRRRRRRRCLRRRPRR